MFRRVAPRSPRELAKWLGYILLLLAPGSSVLVVILLLVKARSDPRFAPLFATSRPRPSRLAAALLIPAPRAGWGCRVM